MIWGIDIEILAQNSDAFKAETMQIKVYDSLTNESRFVEIADIRIMDEPQLVNYNGATDHTQRAGSKFFENEREVKFSVFGGSNGQGLSITVINPYLNSCLNVFICLKGESRDCDFIGKSSQILPKVYGTTIAFRGELN